MSTPTPPSPWRTLAHVRLGACRTWGVEAKFGPSEDSFSWICSPIAVAMGQKAGEKWTAAAKLQPTLPKSDRLLDPPPPDWRNQLATRLGQRPRRIGPWAELALWGARQCLDAAGEPTLPPSALLRVASLSSALTATREGIAQNHSGLPMPFTFMQSQPSQMLAALSQHLGWQGDASFTVCRNPHTLLSLAQRSCGPAGLLLGWVEEGESPHTEWWRLAPA